MNNADKVKPAILIVDDNEDILAFLSDDLSEKYSVFTARNGNEALELLLDQPVQLIISDVMMPCMDGFELCERLRSDFNFSHIPIILLTVKNTVQSKIAGLNSGADVYVEKPFSPEYLSAQVSSLLNNRNRLKDYFAKSPLVHVRSIAHTRVDEEFLERLNALILGNLEDATLDVEKLAVMMNMSRPTLYRKIKSISNLSPSEMINITRLNKAVEWISNGETHLNEIVFRAGFSSLTQLGRSFQRQFNMSPSEYAKKVRSQTMSKV